MNKSPRSDSAGVAAEKLPAPQGIGMGVAFDWGLTVQWLVTPFLPLFLGNSPSSRQMNVSPTTSMIMLMLIGWPIAIVFAVFGEGLRRGWNWVRRLQIVGNSLGFLGGFAILWNLWNSSKHGNYWPVVPSFILLIISPLIAWHLSRPATARWFETVNSAQARNRHGGAWPWLILLWSIAGGLLQAIASFQR